jgi:hypothetical protein
MCVDHDYVFCYFATYASALPLPFSSVRRLNSRDTNATPLKVHCLRASACMYPVQMAMHGLKIAQLGNHTYPWGELVRHGIIVLAIA